MTGVNIIMKAVEVRGLNYGYHADGPAVLKNINFQVNPGEMIGVMGLSGCGKSTLCYCLTGIIPHSWGGRLEGEVLVNGKNTREHTVARLALEVGMVFQNPDTQLFLLRWKMKLLLLLRICACRLTIFENEWTM